MKLILLVVAIMALGAAFRAPHSAARSKMKCSRYTEGKLDAVYPRTTNPKASARSWLFK